MLKPIAEYPSLRAALDAVREEWRAATAVAYDAAKAAGTYKGAGRPADPTIPLTTLDAYVRHGSLNATARALGISATAVRNRLRRAGAYQMRGLQPKP